MSDMASTSEERSVELENTLCSSRSKSLLFLLSKSSSMHDEDEEEEEGAAVSEPPAPRGRSVIVIVCGDVYGVDVSGDDDSKCRGDTNNWLLLLLLLL